jgi:hypothetical protein
VTAPQGADRRAGMPQQPRGRAAMRVAQRIADGAAFQ